MNTISKINFPENQYETDHKLLARQAIYNYSLRQDTVWGWSAKKYPVLNGSKLLEVGCGNGVFWKEALKIFPQNLDITLTDYSKGMLDESKRNLSELYNFRFSVADVENLNYPDRSFDGVFSHYMLYHTNSPTAALLEIRRVLKKSGFCGILLPDNHHMESIFSAIAVDYPIHAQSFSSESAAKVLPSIFASVEHEEYKDIIRINNIEVILNYIASLSDLDKQNLDFFQKAREKLNKLVDSFGFIELSFSQNLFIVKN